MKKNIHHQPIGESVTDFEPLNFPDIKQLDGRYSSLVKLSESLMICLTYYAMKIMMQIGLICLANPSMITMFLQIILKV